jgi:TAT (twin-arginine translocation) pathway signal sequence
MCKLCDLGQPQNHFGSRRNFMKGAVATGVAAAGLPLFAPRPAAADGGDPPPDSGRPGRRYVIRGGSVMSLDPQVGDFAQADQAALAVEQDQALAVETAEWEAAAIEDGFAPQPTEKPTR